MYIIISLFVDFGYHLNRQPDCVIYRILKLNHANTNPHVWPKCMDILVYNKKPEKWKSLEANIILMHLIFKSHLCHWYTCGICIFFINTIVTYVYLTMFMQGFVDGCCCFLLFILLFWKNENVRDVAQKLINLFSYEFHFFLVWLHFMLIVIKLIIANHLYSLSKDPRIFQIVL